MDYYEDYTSYLEDKVERDKHDLEDIMFDIKYGHVSEPFELKQLANDYRITKRQYAHDLLRLEIQRQKDRYN